MTDNSDILQTIHSLRAQLDTLEAKLSGNVAGKPMAPASKPKREVSDAQQAWIAYAKQVWEDMKASGWIHPETGKPPSWTDAMSEAKKRKATDPLAPKPKPKPKPEEPAEVDPEAKPKRKLSPEHLAKMQAGRKAAAERKAAERAAEAASLKEIAVKARKYLWDPETNGCYKRKTDGSKGDWAGVYDPETKLIDASVEEP